MQSATPGAATSLHLPVRQDWLDQRRETIIEPELPIVDPHHHLVDRPETGRYLLPDLLADTGGSQRSEARLTPSAPASLARKAVTTLPLPSTSNGCRCTAPRGPPSCARSARSSSPTGLRRWRRPGPTAGRRSAPASSATPIWRWVRRSKALQAMIKAGGGRFRGIRFITASHPDQAAWGSPVHCRGRRQGSTRRRTFARLSRAFAPSTAFPSTPGCFEPQLREFLDLVRAFPDTQFILDHVGTPLGIGGYAGKREERFAGWAQDIRRGGGACENVAGEAGRARPCRFRGLQLLSWAEGRAVEHAGRGVAALHRDLHRGVHAEAGDVREQLPGRPLQLHLRRPVERLQDHRQGRLGGRKGRAVRRRGNEVLSVAIAVRPELFDGPWPCPVSQFEALETSTFHRPHMFDCKSVPLPVP